MMKCLSRVRFRWLPVGLLPLAFVLPFGCHSGSGPKVKVEPDRPWFADVTDEVGLNVIHDSGPKGDYFMPQLTGGGAALLDFDNDGRLDIYLIQGGGPGSHSTNRLLHQNAAGKFEDVSAGSGVDIAGYGQGVAVGDVNNDGWPDILVTEFGEIRLFLNRHNGTFDNCTKEAGLDNPLWAISAAFLDYDRDGFLDLVVVNYVEYNAEKACSHRGIGRDFCGPSAFPGTISKLFRNLGPKAGADKSSVRYEDTTFTSGLATKAGPGLGVVCADFDGDGWPDIFIANDGAPNHLWMNQKNGTFVEEGVLRGIARNSMGQAEANMGVAIGDVDGQGDFEIFVTHLSEESHRLWKQSPRGHFQDQTGATGLGMPTSHSTGFGTLLADFDHNGAVDLVLVNGRVRRDSLVPAATVSEEFWVPYREPNQLYSNAGNSRFINRSNLEPALCGIPSVWRGVASGDVDGDGALDLLVTRLDGSVRLYRNVAPNRGHWLLVRAMDPLLERDAYGSEITVSVGETRWTRWLNPAYSYACSNDPRAHFGLGSANHVDSIRVLWPDGKKEMFSGRRTDQSIVLKKGEGQPATD